MNREIKFRAYDLENKRMLDEPFDIWHLIHNYNCEYADGREDLTSYNYEFRDEWPILMQYTGLKDKNGKEIYEGDIVGTWGTAVWPVGWNEAKALYSAMYEDGRPAFTLSKSSLKNREVIGNIYENPELLKEKK